MLEQTQYREELIPLKPQDKSSLTEAELNQKLPGILLTAWLKKVQEFVKCTRKRFKMTLKNHNCCDTNTNYFYYITHHLPESLSVIQMIWSRWKAVHSWHDKLKTSRRWDWDKLNYWKLCPHWLTNTVPNTNDFPLSPKQRKRDTINGSWKQIVL